MARLLLVILLCSAASGLQALDLKALEKLAGRANKPEFGSSAPETRCSVNYTSLLGQDLPPDLDPCKVEEQVRLLQQGLYLSRDGVIRALPTADMNSPSLKEVTVPVLGHNPVRLELISPIVLDPDIEEQTGNSLDEPALQSSPRAKLPNRQPSKLTGTKVQTPKLVHKRPLGCPTFATFAHRGSHRQPENSVQALVEALHEGHTGVEIDAQRLRDGTWVIHHDPTTGRTTHGRKGRVSAMSTYHWKQVRLKDRNGHETETFAPFLEDILVAFKENARTSQVLNIEIKDGLQTYSCENLAALDRVIRESLASSQFLYSSRSVESLACMRTLDSKGYLGLVIDPHPDSVLRQAPNNSNSKTSNLLNRLADKIDLAGSYSRQSNRSLLKKNSFADLRDLIGPNYGLHIDFQDYPSFPENLRSENGRVVLYQLGDDEGLQTLLASLEGRRIPMPDGVLVDASRDEYCAGDHLVSR